MLHIMSVASFIMHTLFVKWVHDIMNAANFTMLMFLYDGSMV